MASDLERLMGVRPVSGGEVYFGVSPGWDASKEPLVIPRKCRHCKDGLGGLRYCPACCRVRRGDQATLDTVPYRTNEPDAAVIESYAEVSIFGNAEDARRDADDRTGAAVGHAETPTITRRERRAALHRATSGGDEALERPASP